MGAPVGKFSWADLWNTCGHTVLVAAATIGGALLAYLTGLGGLSAGQTAAITAAGAGVYMLKNLASDTRQ